MSEERAKYNAGIDIERMIDELPGGLDRNIMRILSYHIGRDNAISRGGLLLELAMVGFDYTGKDDGNSNDRPVRLAINQLRKSGVPICSTGGIGGGYWISENWQELNEYLESEVLSRIRDLRETELALKAAGEKMWGRYAPEVQGRLF